MKKILTSIFIIGSFLIYALLNHKTETSNLNSEVTDQTSEAITANNSSSDVLGSQQISSGFKDGSYTGPVVDAFYGNIQVKAIIQNGRLTDVQFLQSPNDQAESIEINADAMPKLKKEAIAAQSGNVNIVSRATDSSIAFKQSLNSALAQAKK